jgi:hypothetical protein
MPRLRAMTPVRIEFGVHFGRAADGVEDEPRVVWEECIRRTEVARGGFSANAHSRSM